MVIIYIRLCSLGATTDVCSGDVKDSNVPEIVDTCAALRNFATLSAAANAAVCPHSRGTEDYVFYIFGVHDRMGRAARNICAHVFAFA